MMKIGVYIGLLLFPFICHADYVVQGKVNLSPNWQNQIFLATIDKLDDYYKSDPNNIINVATIDSTGAFVLTGDNLPLQKQYYRLFLIKETSTEFDACLYVGGDDHNFVHIMLDNQTTIELAADPTYTSPFGNYDVNANLENQLMRDLNRLVHPSYYFYEIRFPSELQFSQDKLNRDLVAFADTCSQPLVGLAALHNVDMDHYFEMHADTYSEYGKKLIQKYRDHTYTNDFFRKLRYYQDPEEVKSFWWPILAGFFGLLTLLLFIRNRKLKATIKDLRISSSVPTPKIRLTNQEQKILSLIVEGKSNKDIASDLYVEVSTVKTHINKLYSKLKVNNRSEAITRGKNLVNTGV